VQVDPSAVYQDSRGFVADLAEQDGIARWMRHPQHCSS